MVLADKSAADLVDEVGGDLSIGLTTLQRTMAGRRAPRPWEIERLAEALEVPRWFLERGLDGAAPAEPPGEAGERLSAELSGLRRDLWKRLDSLEREIRRNQR